MACNGNPGRDEQKESRKTVSGLENVVLAAPDIDTVDMIRQLEAIGHLERPLTLLVLKDDGALALSGFVTGGRRRFGADDAYDPWGPIGGKTVWRSGHLCVSSRRVEGTLSRRESHALDRSAKPYEHVSYRICGA
ncbi:alpha/beta hydrolase [Rhizobium wenxiniae]|uniref:alpha/beta hydrolase n=1 Tax=Rhizobium wenxiniae TaxID=1737357 RepID=UPI001CB79676